MKWPLILGGAAILVAGLSGETLLGAAVAGGAVVLHLIFRAEEAELRALEKNAPKYRLDQTEK